MGFGEIFGWVVILLLLGAGVLGSLIAILLNPALMIFLIVAGIIALFVWIAQAPRRNPSKTTHERD
jgi:Flp pilus assembly protein TadB